MSKSGTAVVVLAAAAALWNPTVRKQASKVLRYAAHKLDPAAKPLYTVPHPEWDEVNDNSIEQPLNEPTRLGFKTKKK